MPCPVSLASTALKVAGTTYLAVLAGSAYTSALFVSIATRNRPTDLALPANWAAVLAPLATSLTNSQTALSVCSTASFIAAFALSPARRRHPYILWCGVFALAGGYQPIVAFLARPFAALSRPPGPSTAPPSAAQSDAGADFATVPHPKHQTATSADSDSDSDPDLSQSVYKVRPPAHKRTISSLSTASFPDPDHAARPSGDQSASARAADDVQADELVAEARIQKARMATWTLGLITALVGLWGER